MLRVNGLFGWVSYNDRRSMLLFVAFFMLFQIAALLALFFPLAILDAGHAPFLNFAGYAVRYAPLVALLATSLFAVRLSRHVALVRKATIFENAPADLDRRIRPIMERLAIAAGIPFPRLAIIEDAARNAFVCGAHSRDTVLVLTRGLLVALDDAELEAVIAHELAHIRRGDAQFMAYADTCLTLVKFADRMNRLSREELLMDLRVLNWIFVTFALPFLLPIFLAWTVMRYIIVQCGEAVRLIMASSREFIADADAIRLTHDPASFIEALAKIDGSSTLKRSVGDYGALMINGETLGDFASHPEIDERIRAIRQLTGSMTLNADIPPNAYVHVAHKRTKSTGFLTALARVSRDGSQRIVGVHINELAGIGCGIVLITLCNVAAWHKPDIFADHFNPRPAITFGQIITASVNGGRTVTPALLTEMAAVRHRPDLLGLFAHIVLTPRSGPYARATSDANQAPANVNQSGKG
jgi:Zn-dependent protease with chaperone function